MFFAPIRPNSQILRNPSFIASLIISILGFRLGSILIILMSSMPPQLSETFELLISILAFRLGSGLIILMQLLRSGGNILHNETTSQTCSCDNYKLAAVTITKNQQRIYASWLIPRTCSPLWWLVMKDILLYTYMNILFQMDWRYWNWNSLSPWPLDFRYTEKCHPWFPPRFRTNHPNARIPS